jgi:hypothetical protein
MIMLNAQIIEAAILKMLDSVDQRLESVGER